MAIRLLALALLLQISFSCNSNREKSDASSVPGKREMTDLNRYFVQKDRERIESYIERKELKMTESRSGLWYLIRMEGSGNYYSDNDRIIMEYDCSLLDGTICYSSKDLGPKEIILGRSKIEAGLSQGLRMLKPGGEAIFIIPPFLAYGLTGDGKKIPAKSVIVYNVKTDSRNN
jgi:FKBP-type peptidyl-prolyl cis-trans isomerase FkpA